MHIIISSLIFVIAIILAFVAFKTYFLNIKIREETLYWASAMLTIAISFLIQLLGYLHIITIYLYVVYVVYNLNYLSWLLEYRALFIMLKYDKNSIPIFTKKILRIIGLLSLWIFIVISPLVGAHIDGAIRLIVDNFAMPNIFDFANNFYFILSILIISSLLIVLHEFGKGGRLYRWFEIGFWFIGIKEIIFFIYNSYINNILLYYTAEIVSLIGACIIFITIFQLFKEK